MFYGVKGAKWAPTKSDEDTKALPTYENVQTLDGINDCNETLNFASASAYGDNIEKIKLSEFTDGSLDVKIVHQEVDCAAVMLGCATDGKGGLSYKADDVAPTGGFGFYHTLLDSKKNKYHEVVFYPKTQATIQGKDYQTKEDDLTMEYIPLTMDVLQPENGIYKIENRFDSEDDAIAYLDGLFTGESTAPGSDSTGSGNGGDTGNDEP